MLNRPWIFPCSRPLRTSSAWSPGGRTIQMKPQARKNRTIFMILAERRDCPLILKRRSPSILHSCYPLDWVTARPVPWISGICTRSCRLPVIWMLTGLCRHLRARTGWEKLLSGSDLPPFLLIPLQRVSQRMIGARWPVKPSVPGNTMHL